MSRPIRESTATPFLVSLVLHGAAAVALVTGLAAPSARSGAAALFRPPATMTFQLVDLPPRRVAQPDEPTPLVAERSARAADGGPRELPEEAPFSRGETSLPSMAPGAGGRAEAARVAGGATPSQNVAQPARTPGRAAGRPGDAAAERPTSPKAPLSQAPEIVARVRPDASPFGDSRLQVPRRELEVPPVAGGTEGSATTTRGFPQVDNRLTRARYEGDFSLSTYEWDYAPYMRRLKQQIEEYTWTILPSAFWYGIAGWATQVRFVILPDGKLESIVITGHEGVLDLRHVAPDAVTGAATFEPLPPGFPEDRLTVTGNFYFNVFPPGEEPDGEDPPAGRSRSGT